MAFNLAEARVRAILLDIEGTTTPIAFVHDVLFSYARQHVRDYLREHENSPAVLADIAALREQNATDTNHGKEPPLLIAASGGAQIDSITSYIHWLIDQDSKCRPLKSLQGKIWKDGYANGSLKAQVFPDVLPAMKRWKQAGLAINIFSSGSTLAQELLFSHTDAGNLTPLIDHYFDTTVGPKTNSESYQKITSALGLPATVILFISDVVAELDAARLADMHTLLSIRPGNDVPKDAHGHQVIFSFDEV